MFVEISQRLFSEIMPAFTEMAEMFIMKTKNSEKRALLSRGYTSDFLLAMVMRFFLKIVASPARGENRMCSHPRTGDATDEKIAEKNREKFNELNFLRQNHGLRQRVATQAIFAARWRRDNFKKSHHHRKQKIARVAAALMFSMKYSRGALSIVDKIENWKNTKRKKTTSVDEKKDEVKLHAALVITFWANCEPRRDT